MNGKNTTAKRLFATTIALALVMAIAPSTAYAGAPPIVAQAGCQTIGSGTLELGLGIDGSGSISSSDFDLQKDAYVSVLNSLLPTDGSVAVEVILFSFGQTVVYPLTIIDSAADKTALLTAIGGMVQPGGLTDIAGTIDDLTTSITTSGNNFDTQIIDISTDGIQTVAGDPVASATAAIAAGIDQVNALGIGTMPNFNMGAGSFSVEVDSFADFDTALMDKLVTELQCQVAGEILQIDTTALFVSGAAANAAWLLPVIAGIAGTGFYLTRSRWNNTSEE